jgi:flagellar hook-length control protein FliK
MSDKRWANNFVSRLNKAHSSKISELEIVLTPKNLGKMKVKISVSDKTAFVKIKTDNPAASSLIQDEQQKLSEMLKEIGLELEDFSSEQSFHQNLHDDKDENQNNNHNTAKNHKTSDENDKENYIEDESILNIKV